MGFVKSLAREVGASPIVKRTTDDRGRYRLWGLPAGRYLVMASTDALPSGLDRARGNAFARVYYPGTPDVESAQSVQVDDGQETTGADVSFAPVRAGRITGIARDAAGEPLIGQVRLLPTQRPGVPAVDPVVERVNFDGTFEINDIPHGEYVVQAVGTNPGHRDEFPPHLHVGIRDGVEWVNPYPEIRALFRASARKTARAEGRLAWFASARSEERFQRLASRLYAEE